jgi:hypothetical protein
MFDSVRTGSTLRHFGLSQGLMLENLERTFLRWIGDKDRSCGNFHMAEVLPSIGINPEIEAL